MLEPGKTERQLQIELEAAFFRAGAEFLAFDTIIAGGPNSAVLHFAPTDRALGAGELVLVDAGAEFRGYASDVSRTYPVSGTFTPEQARLHELVRQAVACGSTCRSRPGHVVTIEPGVYFVTALLQDPETRARHRVSVRWEHVDELLGFGGIRVEQNVLVTEHGSEVLTEDIPLPG